ncbi:hypothetical protein [Flavobacterium sp.]|uniref:hypothetical protein n=1 Tax=Flavobacterium sp. TaxID=239 RepID=UPI0039E66674
MKCTFFSRTAKKYRFFALQRLLVDFNENILWAVGDAIVLTCNQKAKNNNAETMKNLTPNTANQKATSKVMLVALFVLFLSSVGMSAQSVETTPSVSVDFEITVAADTTAAVATVGAESNSNMNMVSWFMGSKANAKGDHFK